MDKLISVIINCYNGEKYLAECLQSVSNQKYKNWEIVFWDNRSNDNSKLIYLQWSIINVFLILTTCLIGTKKSLKLLLELNTWCINFT